MSKKISIEIIDSDSVIFDLDYVKNKVYRPMIFVLRNQGVGLHW